MSEHRLHPVTVVDIVTKNIEKLQAIRDAFMDGPPDNRGWGWILDDMIRELAEIPAGSIDK